MYEYRKVCVRYLPITKEHKVCPSLCITVAMAVLQAIRAINERGKKEKNKLLVVMLILSYDLQSRH